LLGDGFCFWKMVQYLLRIAKFFKKIKSMRHKKSSAGFTLIELLVVITIIGILSTIVMVSLNTARGKARDARRVSDVRQLQLALEMHQDSNGRYPSDLSELAPQYVNAEPMDPNGIDGYQYCVNSARNSYHLGTSVGLESGDGIILLSDADIISDDCASGSFSGEDPIYDVRP